MHLCQLASVVFSGLASSLKQKFANSTQTLHAQICFYNLWEQSPLLAACAILYLALEEEVIGKFVPGPDAAGAGRQETS